MTDIIGPGGTEVMYTYPARYHSQTDSERVKTAGNAFRLKFVMLHCIAGGNINKTMWMV